MSRINQVKRVLKEFNIDLYEIREVTENNSEQYYVKGLLETIRNIQVVETNVMIYVKNIINGKTYLGNSDFNISKNISKQELKQAISDAVKKASYVHNEAYELTKVDKNKKYFYTPLQEEPMVILQKIAEIFNNETTDNLKFNALECFFKERMVEFVNSNGVHLKKKTFTINVEAIPSYYSKDFKTELYRMFTYDNLDYEKIKKDAKLALLDVDNRGKAVKIENVNKCNVILRSEHIKELLKEFISTFNYNAVYSHSNLKNVGDDVQNNPKQSLNIDLDKRSKADFFDSDGVILNKHPLIKNGKLINYFGPNRFAQYLNVKPSGNLPKIILSKGHKSIETLKKKPYIEIIDLSGIQVEAYSSYVGGEVRLALYYDGKTIKPISGFSFSTNLNETLNTMELSKETDKINNYEGPAFMKLENVDII